MKLDTTRENTTVFLGKNYCFNHDKIIDACVYLAAKDYWGRYGKMQMNCYIDNKTVYRNYLRLQFALKRFEDMSESDIFNGVAYGYDAGKWRFGISRNEYRYNKTIETLFEIRGYMWS